MVSREVVLPETDFPARARISGYSGSVLAFSRQPGGASTYLDIGWRVDVGRCVVRVCVR